MFQPWFTEQGWIKRPWKEVHKIHRTALCKCKYLGDPASTGSSRNSKLLPKTFLSVNFCIYQVYRKESNIQNDPFIMSMCHVHWKKLWWEFPEEKQGVLHYYISKQMLWSVLSCKAYLCIYRFLPWWIFLLQVYLKPLCFLSSWFSKWTCCRQMERRLRQDRMGAETGAVLWRATDHSLCQGQPAGREWMNVLVKWRLFV